AIRRLAHEPVGLFATARPAIDLRLGFNHAERIVVGPLPPDELGTLIRERLGARFLRPVLRQLAETSGGNPFYVLELAASLLRSGEKPEPGERLSIPIHLRDVVQSRLDELTPPAREAALATAALARPTLAAVEAVVRDGKSAIAETVSSGILEHAGETIRFTHPLFAASVYENARPADRKAIHKRLAEVVTDPEERARQLAEAADGQDATIAIFVEAAAASAVARGAPDTGVRLAKLAVEP